MATLRVTSGPAEGETISLDHEVVVGREGTDLVISDTELSRRHVAFRPSDGGVVVEDLGSTNGTLVNGERISEPMTLMRDTSVKVGQSELTVEINVGATVMRASPTVMRPARSAAPAEAEAPAEAAAPAEAEAPAEAAAPAEAESPAKREARGEPAVAGPPAGGPPSGGAPAAGPPAGAPIGGPPAGGGPGGPGGRPPGAPGGAPPGAPGATRPSGRRIPEFVPWLVAAAAIAVAVIVAVTSGTTKKGPATKPPHAVQIQPLALGTLPTTNFKRALPNGANLSFGVTGTIAVQVQKVTLQPGASEPWHIHKGSGLAIVESGSVNDYEQVGTGCKLYVVGAGQDRFDVGTVPHSLVNVGKVPVVIFVTGFAPRGQTSALIPKKKPPNCHEQ